MRRSIWSILSGDGRPRLFATQQKAQEAANRLGLPAPIESYLTAVGAPVSLEQSKNSLQSASVGQKEGVPEGALDPGPLTIGNAMSTDKLTTALADSANAQQRAAELTDTLNAEIAQANQVMDTVEQHRDVMKNGYASVLAALAKIAGK